MHDADAEFMMQDAFIPELLLFFTITILYHSYYVAHTCGLNPLREKACIGVSACVHICFLRIDGPVPRTLPDSLTSLLLLIGNCIIDD